MLCLADRNFFGIELWNEARATGADLLWRIKKNLVLDVEEVLPDGSYLSRIYPSIYAQYRKPWRCRAAAATGGGWRQGGLEGFSGNAFGPMMATFHRAAGDRRGALSKRYWIYARQRKRGGVLVRVIEYTLDDPGRPSLEAYRLHRDPDALAGQALRNPQKLPDRGPSHLDPTPNPSRLPQVYPRMERRLETHSHAVLQPCCKVRGSSSAGASR